MDEEIFEATVKKINQKSVKMKVALPKEVIEFLGLKDGDTLGMVNVIVDGKRGVVARKAKKRVEFS